jgi:hypothetical protein
MIVVDDPQVFFFASVVQAMTSMLSIVFFRGAGKGVGWAAACDVASMVIGSNVAKLRKLALWARITHFLH